MDFNTLKVANPQLYWDGIARGAIDYGTVTGEIPVGGAQPNPIVTSFLGGPYAPEGGSFNPDNPQSMTFGGSGNYPKPFLSYSQKLTNANYSYLGAYARMISIETTSFENTCVEGIARNPVIGGGGGVWGRLGVIPDGLGSGELGFFVQNWYNANDGTYDAGFWSERFNVNPPWPDKKTWWEQCTKATIRARFYNHSYRSICKVQVAYGYTEFTDPQYFKGQDLSLVQDYSIDMLAVMTSVAVLTRWL